MIVAPPFSGLFRASQVVCKRMSDVRMSSLAGLLSGLWGTSSIKALVRLRSESLDQPTVF
jgi:hypothetical protein